MENVFLGNVPVTVESGFAPQSSGGYTISPPDGGTQVSLGPPNPDGTYNISLPPDASQSDGVVVAKETDAPESDGTGTGENGDDAGNDQMKKYLPFILVGAAALFFLYMKRKK